MIDPDHSPRAADVFPPALGSPRLNGELRPDGFREDRVPVCLGLPVKELPAWHRDDARKDAPLGQFFAGRDDELDFGARRDEDQIGFAPRSVRQDVSAPA